MRQKAPTPNARITDQDAGVSDGTIVGVAVGVGVGVGAGAGAGVAKSSSSSSFPDMETFGADEIVDPNDVPTDKGLVVDDVEVVRDVVVEVVELDVAEAIGVGIG